MKSNLIMFTAPILSDKSACDVCEFFHDIAIAVDNHHEPQVKRYWKKLILEEEYNQYYELPEEIPF